MNRHFATSFLVGLSAAASGCALGPDFKTPVTPAVAHIGAQAPSDTVSTPIPGGEAQRFVAGKALPQEWWTQFGSEKLNKLVAESFAGSPSLVAARASLRTAHETYLAQRSSLFPAVDARIGATRNKVDTASFGNPAGGTAIYNLYNASVDVSYTLDIFGVARRGVEALAAQYEFEGFQFEGAYQALAANVVTAAVQEARLRQLIQGKQSVIADLERVLQITQKQVDLGAVGRAELLSAQANAATERAQLPALELELARTQNQLAVLLGKAPSERVATDFSLSELTLPQELPVSLPSDLVRQRPDIRAAEAQLHNASARVGVATANRLPQISLNASYGTQSSQSDQLFRGDVWNIGVNLLQPIFRAGRLSAERRAAVAAYDQAEAQYKLTVLQAFQNVADAMRTLEADAQILQAQYEAAKAADEGLRLIEKQYEAGVVSYRDVLTVQQQTTLAKTGLVQAMANRYQDTAALFLALGGGWWSREPAAP